MSRSPLLSARVAFLLCCGVTSISLPSVVHCVHADEASILGGVKLPKGASPFTGVNERYGALLTALSKEKPVARKATGEGPEVFIWRGASYREDRVAFTKSAFTTALETAGYTVTEISGNDLREVNIFEHFPTEEKLPFNPAIWKSSNYLLAQNVAAKRAFIAAWLESDDALALGVLPVEFKAPRGPAQWPAIGANTVVIKNWKNVASSLPAPATPAYAPLAPKSGTARGWLKDGKGKPLANAEVVVESSYGGGFRTHHKARSDARGLYQVLLPKGIARVVSAEATLTYNGRKFTLPLVPVKGEARQFDAAKGSVENFVLRTSGQSGGVIRITQNVPENSEMELTLVPQGPLMDGSTGKTLVYRYVASPYAETYLVGLPLGRYRFSARVNDEGDIIPIRVGRPFGSENQQAKKGSLIVDFEPGYTYSNMVSANPAVAHFQISMEP